MSRQPRVIISGQIPPPLGGQALMIQRLLDGMKAQGGAVIGHLPFYFTRSFHSARRPSPAKILELMKVLARLIGLRLRGPIDLFVFAPGGPQNVPLVRDLFLLPWILLASEKVVLHFHAGGIKDLLDQKPNWLIKGVAWLYSKAEAAVVMTEFNRRDPESCGIREVAVIPHMLEDENREGAPGRSWLTPHILYVGNLHGDKGTSILLRAFSELLGTCPEARLELAGECHPPYSRELLDREIKELRLESRVSVPGRISGKEKDAVFARANCFVFPTIAPSESFGLVLIEAMMWGLPIIASDWRGNADVLAGSAGGSLFSPADSMSALAEALIRFHERQEEWKRMGRASRAVFLAKYCRKEITGPLEHYFLKLAQD